MNITRRIIYVLSLILATSFVSNAQIAINSDGSSPDASAMLDVTSVDKGILVPRMTTSERTAISSPATGLLVYDTDFNTFWYYANAAWGEIGSGAFTSENGVTQSNNNDDDFIFGADSLNYGTGTEAKFFFDKSKGAFRSGLISTTNWDQDSIGNYSFGVGYDVKAIGYYSAAFGNNTAAEGDNSIALGINTEAIGSNSAAFGNGNKAEGDNSTAFGVNTEATGYNSTTFGLSTTGVGDYSTAFGNNTAAGGDYSTTFGNNTEAEGDNATAFGTRTAATGYNSTAFGFFSEAIGGYSTAFGYFSEGAGDYSTALGYNTTAYSYGEIALGIYSSIYTPNSTSSFDSADRLFGIGNGTANGSRSDAFVIHKNGNVSLNGGLTIDSAYTFPIADGTSNQTLQTDGNGTLTWVTNTDDQIINTFNITGDSLFISLEDDGQDAHAVDLESYLDNTDDQIINTFNITGDSLFISLEDDGMDAHAVGLESYLDNTDDQAINVFALSGNTLQLSLEDDDTSTLTLDMSTITPLILADADADTKIQVEKSSDEDIIRFDLGGTEYFQMKGHQFITPLNNVFIGDGAGESDLLQGSANIFIGYQAGKLTDDGETNIGIGFRSMENNTSGDYNVGLGLQTLFNLESGSYNTALGSYALQDKTSGEWNTAIGVGAMQTDATSKGNTSIGGYSLYSNNTGNYNSVLGYESSSSSSTASKTVAIGAYALQYNNGTGSNVAIGYEAGRSSGSSTGNIFIGYQAGKSESNSNRLYIHNSNTTEPLIYGDFDTDILEFNGRVGIGTTPVNAKLEILGVGDTLADYTFGYLNNSGNTGTYTVGPVYSIYADNKVGALAFHAHSDERIKNIQGISNSKDDLNTLMNIEITNYTMKDSIAKGNEVTKKVIAQQVKSVYPKAVSTNTIQVVPDIYQTATIDENGWISFNGKLQKGEKIQIIFDDKKEILEVLETKENAFRVETLHCNACTEESTVFLYGRQVNDFHTVDYEAISMLNVSATQQLAKENKILKERMAKLESLSQNLEKENIELKAQVEKINQLEAKLEAFLNQ